MEPKFAYHFDSSTGIQFKTYYGSITIEDIESSWEYAFANNLLNPERKGFILDYLNSSFCIDLDRYTAISNFYKKHLDVFGNFKIAILIASPKDIIIPVLVEYQDDGYCSKPFSTLEAAIEWVLSID